MNFPPAWFILALLCAFFWSVADVLSKNMLGRHGPEKIFWARWGYALPFLAAFAPFVPIPEIGRPFWYVVALALPLEVAAGLLYLRALQLSPLSLTVPLLAWTPVFAALFAWLFMGEVPTSLGAAGILLVGVGSYLLASGEGRGLLEPLLALGRDRGCRLMIVVAMIYSITSALGKIGVLNSSASFFGIVYTASVAGAFLFILVLSRGTGALGTVGQARWFWALGAAMAAMIFFHFRAIEMTQVGYMISVKRSSLVFTVLFGRLFFRERQTGRRFAGALVMFAGMAIITTAP